ncbi:IQ domain-containing protein E-like, partial [Argonauta hians]
EELQIQMETLYHEVTRLRTANKEQRAFKDNFNTTKIKALSETVLRLNQSMEELRGENFALKKDLMEMANQGKVVECGTPRKAKANSSKLEDMTKQELLDLIATQNQIIEHFENKKKHLAQYLANRAMNKVPGKVTLQGDVWRQVEQLDQQESQLLKELKVAKDKKKLMKSDKNRFKKRNEELEQECYKLQLTIKELELKPKTDPNNTTTTTTTTTTANTTTTTANTTTTTTPAATTVTTTDATSLEQHHRHPRSSTAPHPDRLSRRESKAREMSGENSKKVNQEGRFSVKTRDRQAAAGAAAAAAAAAAAEETVQAAVKGHLARHKVLQRAGEPVTSGGGGGGGLEKAVLLIQSVLRGHHTRRRRLLQSRDRNNPSMEPLMAR